MQTTPHPLSGGNLPQKKPYAMVGAGKLASTIWKTGNASSGWRYFLNVFRFSNDGSVGHTLRPTDLMPLVKLVQVLAATLTDDGCLAPAVRAELERLALDLDRVLNRDE